MCDAPTQTYPKFNVVSNISSITISNVTKCHSTILVRILGCAARTYGKMRRRRRSPRVAMRPCGLLQWGPLAGINLTKFLHFIFFFFCLPFFLSVCSTRLTFFFMFSADPISDFVEMFFCDWSPLCCAAKWLRFLLCDIEDLNV